MTIYLLDINLLLYLADPMHVHHELSHQWFAKKGRKGWATCPLTENGFVRIAAIRIIPTAQETSRTYFRSCARFVNLLDTIFGLKI